MDFKVIFDNCSLLFEYFGWYSILLVLGTFTLMIPLNLLYKKIMKKEVLIIKMVNGIGNAMKCAPFTNGLLKCRNLALK